MQNKTVTNIIKDYSVEEIYNLVDQKLSTKFADPAERVEIVSLLGEQIIKESFMKILLQAPDVKLGEAGYNQIREYMEKNDPVNLAKECERIGVPVFEIFSETAESVLKTVLEE